MTSRLRAFGAFLYDFVIGDDWRVAVGVVIALGLTFWLSHVTSVATWWLVPVALVVLLPLTLWRVVRKH
jgi:hypothetical protein